MQAIATRLTRFSLAFALLLCTPAANGKDLSSDSEAAGWRAQAFQQSLKGEKDEALESYQKAVDTALRDYGPDSSYIGDLYYEMGTLALDAKKTHKAEVYLQKAVQQNPNSIMGRVKYSEALELVGRKDEAYQQIQAALAKHKNSPEAREALVLWWQSKAKEDGLTKQAKNVYQSRAFQESSILGQSLKGPAPVVTPSQTMVASAAAKPVEAAKPAIVAASAPATKPEGFKFPWAMKPKTEPAKKEEKPAPKPTAKKEEKPAAKAKEVKKAEPKQEPKKKGKKAKAESAPKPSAPTQPLQLKAEPKPALVTSAKQLPKPKAESPKKADTEEIQAPDQPPPKKEEAKKEQPKPVAQPPALNYIPIGFPKNNGKPRKPGLVPPPPPMTPSFPGSVPYYAPPPQAVQPPPKAEPKPKPKKEPAKESESKGSGNSEDPDFILEWAGKKKK